MSEQPRRFCPTCGGEYDGELEDCPEDGTTLRDLHVGDDEDSYLVGETLDDRYVLQEKFGEGAMGYVYLADQLSIDRRVAIKVMKPEVADHEVVVKRFYREAQVISQIQHPNVVNLFDFGRDDRGLLYLVMELIEGIGFDEVLSEGASATCNFALEIAKQCCAGLAQIHSEGVVHRDVKPENLMLVPLADGRVQLKVVDFGIALAGRDQGASLTQTGVPVGTALYMAPEQAGSAEVSGAADVYALGAVLYELLAGRAPFTGSSPMKLLQKHLDEQPESLGSLLPEGAVPEALVETVDRMLAKAPEDRPGDAAGLRSQFSEIQSELDAGPISVAPEAWPEALYESHVTKSRTVRQEDKGEKSGDAEKDKGQSRQVPTSGTLPADREEGLPEFVDTPADRVDSRDGRPEATPTRAPRMPAGDGGGPEGSRLGSSSGRDEVEPVAAPSSSTTEFSSSGDTAFWMVIGAGLLFVMVGSAAVYRMAGPEILEVFGFEVVANPGNAEKRVTLKAEGDPLVVYRSDERLGETPVTVAVDESTTFRIERRDVSGTVVVSPSSPDVLEVRLKTSGGVPSKPAGE